jgi:pyruvate-formate lyase-activating enzyme
MTRPIMSEYFSRGGTFRDRDGLIARTAAAPKRQVYFSGLFVYSLLTSHGHDVELINCLEPGDPELASKFTGNVDIILISTSFLAATETAEVVAEVRRFNPEAPLFIGGRWVWNSFRVLNRQDSEAYAAPEVRERYFFTMSKPIDGVSAYIVAPSGIPSLLKVLDHLAQGKKWNELQNLAIPKKRGGFDFTEQCPDSLCIEDLNIDWPRIPRNHLSTVMPMACSLGCPFRCRFCNFPSEKHIRKPLEILRRELRELVESHRFVQSIWFIDDNILLNRKQIEDFCRMMREEDLPITWRSFIRADVIDEDIAGMLKESGCELLIIGMESVDNRVLASMGKKAVESQYVRAAQSLTKVGLSAELSFILGFPGEDERSVAKLCEFLSTFPAPAETAVYFLYLFIFHLAPLAEAFEESFRRQWDLKGSHLDWSHKTMNVDGARAALKQAYLAADSDRFFLNYLDCHPALMNNHEMAIRSLRERVAKARMLGKDATELKRQLAELVSRSLKG